jgi:hypothetical protein
MKGLNLALAISLALSSTVMANNPSANSSNESNLTCTMQVKGKLDSEIKAQLKDFTENKLPEFLQTNCVDCKKVNISCKKKK